jgi:hypothetical protein
MPAKPEALSTVCTCASIAVPDTPLGTIWNCTTKSGSDEGFSKVDGMLVMDSLKAGFEKGNIHGIMAKHDHHSQTCPGLISCSIPIVVLKSLTYIFKILSNGWFHVLWYKEVLLDQCHMDDWDVEDEWLSDDELIEEVHFLIQSDRWWMET